MSKSAHDELLNGSINDKKSFDCNLQKILNFLNMTLDDLMLCNSDSIKSKQQTSLLPDPLIDYKMSEVASEQYQLLLDIIDLCAIYY